MVPVRNKPDWAKRPKIKTMKSFNLTWSDSSYSARQSVSTNSSRYEGPTLPALLSSSASQGPGCVPATWRELVTIAHTRRVLKVPLAFVWPVQPPLPSLPITPPCLPSHLSSAHCFSLQAFPPESGPNETTENWLEPSNWNHLLQAQWGALCWKNTHLPLWLDYISCSVLCVSTGLLWSWQWSLPIMLASLTLNQ